MKPFLGIDITEDRRKEVINGDELIVARPSEASYNALLTFLENTAVIEEKSKLFLPIRAAHWILGFACAVAVVVILQFWSKEDMTFAAIYADMPWLFYIFAACGAVWLILKLISRKKKKTVIGSDEYDFVSSKLDNAAKNVLAELKVPVNAYDVDILSCRYKIKNGVPKACLGFMESSLYTNNSFKAFKDTENLYFATYEGKLVFPLYSFKKIHTVNKYITVSNWNKETPPNKGEYKEFKVGFDSNGAIRLKPYHILEAEINGETWGIYFPNYELPVIESLTGLKAE